MGGPPGAYFSRRTAGDHVLRMEAARSKISDESVEVDCRFVARASVLELNTLNHQFLHGKDL